MQQKIRRGADETACNKQKEGNWRKAKNNVRQETTPHGGHKMISNKVVHSTFFIGHSVEKNNIAITNAAVCIPGAMQSGVPTTSRCTCA